jgi:apolipoprotein N-acyltransferase
MASALRFRDALVSTAWSGSVVRAILAFALGLLSVSGLPPLSLWPIFFLTVPGLVLLLDAVAESASGASSRGLRLRRAAAVGWWFGFGYFLAGLYWIGFAFLVEADKFAWLLPLAVTALPAGLAVFFALGTTVAMVAWTPGFGRVFALAGALGASEWLRGTVLSGLPWNAIGYALASDDRLLQAASLVGVTGLSVVTIVVFGLPVARVRIAALKPAGRSWLVPAGLSLGLLAALLGFGAWRLAAPLPPAQGQARLRLVQPNIPQAEKWAGENRQRIFDTFLDLSRRDPAGAPAGFAGVTHVVWPESSLPFLMLQSPEALAAIGDLLPDGVVLVTGSLRAEVAADGTLVQKDGQYVIFNDIAVLDDAGRVVSTYDKVHLVPFGEYLPFQSALEAIGLEQLTRLKGGFAAGAAPRQIAIPGLPPPLPLICYEAIFPEAAAAKPDQTWLLNLTNDAWFGRSAGPYQHLMQARTRAVEQGLPLIRVANTGITAVIGARGEVLASLGLETRGVIETTLPGPLAGKPLYARAGDGVLAGLLALCALAAGLGRRRGSRA